jgi:TonB-dependent siderophore receptor
MDPIALWPLKPVTLAVLALVLVCGVNTPLLAQVGTAAPAGALPEIRVTDSATPSSLYTVPEVSIGKTPQSLKETPQSISVITRQRLDDQNITKLEDALKQTTGVTVQRFDGAGNYNTLQSRGFDIGSIMLDGIPISQNGNFSTALDTAMYERIEVLRGPAGLLQGAGEPGGTINMVRKRAYAPLAIGLNVTAGSFGLRRADVDIGGALNKEGTLRARVVAVKEDRNSHVDTIFNNRTMAYGTLEYDFTPATTLSLGHTRQTVQSVVDQGLPTYANGQLADLPRSSFAGLRTNRQDLETQDRFAELEHRLDQGGLVKFSARHVERASFYRAARSNTPLAANGDYTLSTVDFDTHTTDRNYDLFYSSPLKIGERTHQLLLGLSRNENEAPGGVSRTGANMAANLFRPNYDLPYPNLVLPANNTLAVKREDAAYGQFQFSATNRLKLIAGGRFSWAQAETRNITTGALAGAAVKPGRQFIPAVSAIYALDAQISAYAGYAETFVVQTALDAGGRLLEPRTGTQVELGLKGEFFNKRLNAHAAVFRILDKGRAISDPVVPTASIAGGEVRAQGFETEVSGQVSPGWDLTAGYAYTETLYLKAPAAQLGTVFSPFTPKHIVNLSTRYALRGALQGWSVGGGMVYRSEFSAQAGAIRLVSGNYTLFNAQLAYQLNDKVSVSLSAENLFDKTYYEKVSNTSRQNFYGEPRKFVLALRARY